MHRTWQSSLQRKMFRFVMVWVNLQSDYFIWHSNIGTLFICRGTVISVFHTNDPQGSGCPSQLAMSFIQQSFKKKKVFQRLGDKNRTSAQCSFVETHLNGEP